MDLNNINIPEISNSIDSSLLKSMNEIARAKNTKEAKRTEADNSAIFLAELERLNFASEFAKQIISSIRKFDAELDADHEVGLKLVSYGQTTTFHVSGVGFYNPSLVIFTGLTDNGGQVELVQHISQISFLLLKLPKLQPDKPKRPIGFINREC